MRVPEEIHKYWNEHLEPGDRDVLAARCKCSHPVLRRALNEKVADESIIIQINKFFAERAKRVNESFKSISKV
jgi:hypothetical protein